MFAAKSPLWIRARGGAAATERRGSPELTGQSRPRYRCPEAGLEQAAPALETTPSVRGARGVALPPAAEAERGQSRRGAHSRTAAFPSAARRLRSGPIKPRPSPPGRPRAAGNCPQC